MSSSLYVGCARQGTFLRGGDLGANARMDDEREAGSSSSPVKDEQPAL
jgi:hypothetical protein